MYFNPYNDSSHPRDGEYIILISEEENVKSLNSIDVIFHKNQRVRQAWKSYMDEADKPSSNPQQLNDRYIKLLEEMALICGYKDIRWNNLKRYYYPSGLSNRKNDDEILKSCKLRPQKRPRPMRLSNKILLKMNSSLTK